MNWFPILLTLKIAVCSTLIVVLTGVPFGWLMARGKIPGKSLLSSLAALPMVLPPTVLGYYLLVLLGRQSFPGRFLQEQLGISLVFTWQAAVIAAAVVAFPLLSRNFQAAVETVDKDLEDVARTLGKTEIQIFFTITLPLARRGLLAGVVLAFARSMGEFGATLMVAGNIPGKTQTLSIAIYDAVQSGNSQLAGFLVLLISISTVVILMSLNFLDQLKKW
ncbi:molybdate ABC transporter permease subunit [Candidatus Contubernalis alkaliaceticus]|uniref:molybdate ABC transporter permease subunit n=1 Tax=Candidatus Contubernalis alkaliaceticus TaxID=338645 RepID=UPI001F4BDDB5|nr:molybdate ABC transporter permease subunit [Candidatus Contubernalis alkalaceticus]